MLTESSALTQYSQFSSSRFNSSRREGEPSFWAYNFEHGECFDSVHRMDSQRVLDRADCAPYFILF